MPDIDWQRFSEPEDRFLYGKSVYKGKLMPNAEIAARQRADAYRDARRSEGRDPDDEIYEWPNAMPVRRPSKRIGDTASYSINQMLQQLEPWQLLDLREAINALIAEPGPVRDAFVARHELGRGMETREVSTAGSGDAARWYWDTKSNQWKRRGG